MKVAKLRNFVFCRTQFDGMHRWKDAPETIAFLRDFHRHMFHVRVWVEVTGLNREVEFITLKHKVSAYLHAHFAGWKSENSCEQIANDLLNHFGAYMVEVSEDGENGALVMVESEQEAKTAEHLASMIGGKAA